MSVCLAINQIDFSGLETLEELNHRLGDAGITLHLSEVKGPVLDRLTPTRFLAKLSGRVLLSQNKATRGLAEGRSAAAE